MLDLLETSFNARCKADTIALLEAMKALDKDYNAGGTRHTEIMGEILVSLGRYEEALEVLRKNTAGPEQTTRGFYYLKSLYYVGRANEALGYIPEAISSYEEILSFWNNADIELDFITDARRRLERLSS